MSVRAWVVGMIFSLLAAPCTAESPPEVGSATEPAVVAVVNGESIFFEDVETRLASSHTGKQQTDRGVWDLDRLLQGLISDALLAQEARATGMHEEQPIAGEVESFRNTLALRRLEHEELDKPIEVSNEELRAVFERDYATADVHILTVDEREQAEPLLEQLRDGAEFEELAREHSVDQYSARGGKIEDIERMDLPPLLGRAIWEAQPGGLAGPVRTGLGWTVARVDAFPELTDERFEQLRGDLDRQVRFQKYEIRRADLVRKLRESIPVEIDRALVSAIDCERLQDGRLKPIIDDATTVVATVGGRTIDAGTLGQALQKRWRSVRNREAALAAKSIVLQRLIGAELMQAEAVRRGYGETAESERTVGAFEKQKLIRRYIKEVVTPQIEVADEEMADFFEKQKEEYRKPPRVHVGQITVAEEEQAQKLADLLREGADLGWLARQHSIDRFKDVGGARGWMVPTPGLDRFQDALHNGKPGDVIGPAGTPGNWIVYQITSREEQGYYTLQEVDRKVRSILFAGKFTAYLEDYLLKLRERSEIEVHRDVLESMRISGEQQDSEAPELPRSHGG